MPALRTLAVAVALALTSAAAQAQSSGLGPADAEKTLSSLQYTCLLPALCPLSDENYAGLKRALAGDRESQFWLGYSLLNGRGAPSDRKAGLAWIAKAAEAGLPQAVRYVENKLQDGENIELDETKAATALKAQADKGDVESMLVLAPMMIRGRGTAQDPDGGIALMLKAADRSKGGKVEYEIAELYLIGTNGLEANHAEAMKWYTRAASRGNIDAMSTLGGLWENEPTKDWSKMMEKLRQGGDLAQLVKEQEKTAFKRNIAESYCWRVRAALLDSNLSQYELALMMSRSDSDSFGNERKPDLVQADFWFRLGARNREYDNSQVRGAIEPKMTTAQLEQAKKLVVDFRKLDFEQMKATPITLPGADKKLCPPMP
jgi:TPR repeat protein